MPSAFVCLHTFTEQSSAICGLNRTRRICESARIFMLFCSSGQPGEMYGQYRSIPAMPAGGETFHYQATGAQTMDNLCVSLRRHFHQLHGSPGNCNPQADAATEHRNDGGQLRIYRSFLSNSLCARTARSGPV